MKNLNLKQEEDVTLSDWVAGQRKIEPSSAWDRWKRGEKTEWRKMMAPSKRRKTRYTSRMKLGVQYGPDGSEEIIGSHTKQNKAQRKILDRQDKKFARAKWRARQRDNKS